MKAIIDIQVSAAPWAHATVGLMFARTFVWQRMYRGMDARREVRRMRGDDSSSDDDSDGDDDDDDDDDD